MSNLKVIAWRLGKSGFGKWHVSLDSELLCQATIPDGASVCESSTLVRMIGATLPAVNPDTLCQTCLKLFSEATTKEPA